MSEKIKIKDLIKQDLAGFRIEEMFEICKVNEEGIKVGSIGFLKNEAIAKANIQTLPDSNFYRVESKLVLTNGTTHFYLVNADDEVTVLDEAKISKQAADAILSKLSDEQRYVLKQSLSEIL